MGNGRGKKRTERRDLANARLKGKEATGQHIAGTRTKWLKDQRNFIQKLALNAKTAEGERNLTSPKDEQPMPLTKTKTAVRFQIMRTREM